MSRAYFKIYSMRLTNTYRPENSGIGGTSYLYIYTAERLKRKQVDVEESGADFKHGCECEAAENTECIQRKIQKRAQLKYGMMAGTVK